MTDRVKDVAPFPIPMDGLFRTWNRDGTLRNRLRAAFALAIETETGNAVLLDSVVDQQIKAAIDCSFAEALHSRRTKK